METGKNKKFPKALILSIGLCLIFSSSFAQSTWPVSGQEGNISITVFKPMAEDYTRNMLNFRAAIAMYENNGDPVFGAIWGDAQIAENSNSQQVTLSNVNITDIRFPDGITEGERQNMIRLLEQTFQSKKPRWDRNDITADLEQANKETRFASAMDHTPPKIIYSREAALLVSIDGDPIIENTGTSGIDAVINTPFLILKYQNNFYLSNGELWYKSPQVTGNYAAEKNPPKAVKDMAKSLQNNEEAIAETKGSFYPKIIVSTVPAELIQTKGAATFSAIAGTSLLYVDNTEEDIFMDINNQSYYVLLSGRWYRAGNIDGPWSYVDPEALPSDFARIPEGSDKDVVLANVPGTKAAGEAIKDARVPHTAAVSRDMVAAEVIYDGNPVFETIQGTNIRLATNSSNTVLQEGNVYFLVDDGIWFTGNSPQGPWTVSDYRPQNVNDIPPSSPAYNVKYVNIYHSTPEIVYVGYTSGYVSNYIVGPVVVYGTGHRYNPWRGRYYYARPCTWGFGMYYNPWYGWSMNITYGIGGYGWFGFYSPYRPHYWGHHRYAGCGWWGPPVYRPPYGTPYDHYYGPRQATTRPVRYGNNVTVRRTAENRQIHNTNIYNYNRRGVSPTRGNAPTTRPVTRENNYNYSNRARPADLTKEINRRPVNTGNTNVNRQPSTRPANPPAVTNPGRDQNSQPATRPSNNPDRQSTTRPSNNNPNRQPATRPSNTGRDPVYQRPSTRPTQTPNRQPATRPSNNNQNRQQMTRPSNTNQQPTVRPNTGNNRQQRINNSSTTPRQSGVNRNNTNRRSR